MTPHPRAITKYKYEPYFHALVSTIRQCLSEKDIRIDEDDIVDALELAKYQIAVEKRIKDENFKSY